jgi:hypothetical protein
LTAAHCCQVLPSLLLLLVLLLLVLLHLAALLLLQLHLDVLLLHLLLHRTPSSHRLHLQGLVPLLS